MNGFDNAGQLIPEGLLAIRLKRDADISRQHPQTHPTPDAQMGIVHPD